MGPRRQQQRLLYFCYAAAVIWCATMAQTSAAPRPDPAEQQSNEDDDAHGLPDARDIAHAPDDDIYYDYEHGLKYDETAADDESDYYASIAAELTTALPSHESLWPVSGDDSLSYSQDYTEDGTTSDEALAAGDVGKSESDGALEGRRPRACRDVAALFEASDEECEDVSSEDYPYSY